MFGFYDSYLKFFGLTITYYGLIIACAMAIGITLACFNAKKRGLTSSDILLVACYIIPLAIIGARVYYVLFSLDQFSSFVQVLRIWDGGLAIYGGVIGGAIGVTLYCLIHKKNFLDVADVAVPSLLLGQAIGRIGCYFGGCCYGIVTNDPGLQWFPISTMIDGQWHLSTFFYESLWNFIGFGILIFLLQYFKVKQRGAIASAYLIWYGVGRASIETIRGDSLYIGSIKVSQLLSIILVVAGVALFLTTYFLRYKLAKKPTKILTQNISKNQKKLSEKYSFCEILKSQKHFKKSAKNAENIKKAIKNHENLQKIDQKT